MPPIQLRLFRRFGRRLEEEDSSLGRPLFATTSKFEEKELLLLTMQRDEFRGVPLADGVAEALVNNPEKPRPRSSLTQSNI